MSFILKKKIHFTFTIWGGVGFLKSKLDQLAQDSPTLLDSKATESGPKFYFLNTMNGWNYPRYSCRYYPRWLD